MCNLDALFPVQVCLGSKFCQSPWETVTGFLVGSCVRRTAVRVFFFFFVDMITYLETEYLTHSIRALL
jgi:hypothetical protein